MLSLSSRYLKKVLDNKDFKKISFIDANKNLNNSLITCFWSDHSGSNDTQTFGEVQRGTDVMYFGWRNSGGGASVFPIDHGSVDTDWQMRISGTYVAAN